MRRLAASVAPLSKHACLQRDPRCSLGSSHRQTFERPVRKLRGRELHPVSYTHLTLPTILLV
eukprot:3325833-Pleurochrysis_carterae.AAC.2